MAHAINAAKARLKKNQLAVGIGVRWFATSTSSR